jgi:alkyldihydroxyacetonephosphate synthase
VANPIHVNEAQQDFRALAMEIQRRQQALVYVSGYHIHAASKVLRTSPDTISRALAAVGCHFWPEYQNCPSCWNALELPASSAEQWATLLHFGHTLSSFFEASRPKWCKWLNETGTSICETTTLDSSYVRELIDALGKFFDKADVHVDKALTQLRAKGFGEPDGCHVIQFITRQLQDFPLLLIRAAVSFRIEDQTLILNGARSLTCRTKHEEVRTFISSTNEDHGDDDESFGFWGFRDSGFVLQAEPSGSMSVTMKGKRYGICGKSLKKLIPFIERETKTRINPFNESAFPPLTLGPLGCNLCQEDVELLQTTMAKISLHASDRARHGSGHSQEDVYLIRSGSIAQIRVPDVVVWPSSEGEVRQLVSMAKSKEWCLIPFGGGTNVSHATRCPAKEVEPRPILSVDMRLMNRVLWVNEEDGLAHVEAGITGRDLVQEMLRRGYTIGHEPDSIEFSTLGGWIATKASGMKRNKYGNIEDIVKSVRVAGSEGVLWRGEHAEETSTYGRESRGIDLLSFTVGSEGCFGIITSAVIRIWPLPECQEHDSVILPDFEHGLRFSRDVARLGPNLPSSVRLLDNEHFRLGQALQGESTMIECGMTYLWKMAHSVARSCSAESTVCATIAFEGTRDEVASQRRAIRKLASRHGGTCVGARVGKAGYELTFAIAYLRDFAMTYSFLAESFETFAPWSKVESIICATKERIKKEHQLRCLPGEPFIGSRVTQLYHEGACLYFYLCINIHGVKNPSSVFAEIEHAARQEILDRGGSLSHHHGIGKVRSEFNKKMDSDAFHNLLASLKRSVDPSNTFGAQNGAIEMNFPTN